MKVMAKPTKPTGPNATVTKPPMRAAPEETPGADRRPTNEQVAVRAYEIYLARGGEDGRDQEDWYQAERELMLGRQ